MINTRDHFVELDMTVDLSVIEHLRDQADIVPTMGAPDLSVSWTNALPIEQRTRFNNKLDEFFDSQKVAFQVFLMIPPYTHFPWHIDPNRQASVNIILEEYDDNHTFLTNAPTYEDLAQHKWDTVSLKYKYQRPYLLNVHDNLHCIYNASPKLRKIFSICTHTPYHEALAWWGDTAL